MDVGVAVAVLVLTSPVLALAALAILATMGRPVLHRQRRAGRGGRSFTLLEFRIMDPRPCPNWPDALRVTPVGRVLRATGVEALPQLLNVLAGDMSLVGPRALLPEDVVGYARAQARRHEMRPGITGLVQVSGRSRLTSTEKLELEVWYADHASLALDVRILWRTFLAALYRGSAAVVAGPITPGYR